MKNLLIFALLCLCPAAWSQTAPVITSVTPASATVAEYAPFQATIAINAGTLADNQPPNNTVPYDPAPPSYQAALKRSESALSGISVDASLTAPSGTVIPWPCYWGENEATGVSGWYLNAPTSQVGTWHGTITATDAAGTTTGSQFSFTVTAPAAKGYVHVSPTDGRYFEYSDGSPFIAAGFNAAYGSEVNGIMAGIHAGGGTGFGRLWLAYLGLIGGNQQDGQGVQMYSGTPTQEDAHTGRYCLRVPVPSGFGPQIPLSGLTPGTVYTLTAYLKGVGETTSPPALYTSLGVASPVGPTDSRGWQQVQKSFTAPASGSVQVGLGDYGSSTGHLLVDDLTVTNPAGGDVLGGGGSFEWHTNYNQAVAAEVDALLRSAQSENTYLKLNCLNKFDFSLASVGADGAGVSYGGMTGLQQSEASLGGSTDPNADTPVQRLERYYARYLMARWGAYTSVHSWEAVNEMDYNDGIHYAGAQAFAHALRAWSRDGTALGKVPVTSSTALNGGGITYDPNFYEGNFPDITYKDYHFYTDSTDASRGPSLAYDDAGNLYQQPGNSRVTTGGPGGLGCLHFSVAAGPNQSARWLLPTLKGHGTYTVSFWARATGGATFGASPNAQVHMAALPAGYAQFPSGGITSPSGTWTQYTGTFALSDDLPHAGGFVNVYSCLKGSSPTGSGIDFADVKVLSPDGLPAFRVTFNEPLLWQDSASLATYLAGSKATNSGAYGVERPFVAGETELLPTATENLLNGATAGVFARQAFYAEAVSPFAQYSQWWHNAGAAITAAGGWRYEGGVERFLAGLPLSSGHWRDWGGTASPQLRIVGQSDRTTGNAVLWVQNNGSGGDGVGAANWYDLGYAPLTVVPVGGSVVVPGLPVGGYSVQAWDTALGAASGPPVIEATDGAGNLTVPVNALAGDEAFRITPAGGSPSLSLSLSADKTSVKRGDVLTFTLAYSNSGGAAVSGVVVPWAIPARTVYAGSSAGGVYDPAAGVVTFALGTVGAGASGTVTLTVIVQ